MRIKQPNNRDIEVGRRVRARRTQLGLSQEKLADALGLTFQQVQKYEKGTNRIGAGRLHQISEFLDVPVSFFFDPLVGVSKENQAVMSFMNAAHALRLMQAYSKIKNRQVQHTIVELVESIADS